MEFPILRNTQMCVWDLSSALVGMICWTCFVLNNLVHQELPRSTIETRAFRSVFYIFFYMISSAIPALKDHNANNSRWSLWIDGLHVDPSMVGSTTQNQAEQLEARLRDSQLGCGLVPLAVWEQLLRS